MADNDTPTPGTPAAASGNSPGAPEAVDALALERAFLKGLGVPDLHLPQGLTTELMRNVGAILREATQGTIELLRLRSEAKSSLHADMTMIGSADVNPLKAAWDADVALEHLLAPQRNDIMQPVRAVVDAYDDLRLHDQGLASGIHAAVNGLLARFAPDEIEQRAGAATALDRLVPGSHKARQWEVLLERYEDFSVEAKQDFWRAFELEFRRAYAAGQPARKAPPRVP
ncbi:MAG TPA: type VI secretion system-associated FHA domain protein TagH [Casimicrobiaceae bacterium]|nr:type VI secretion system-associated FHA domain protein TagH [Casimicrobiaceae bacterium]